MIELADRITAVAPSSTLAITAQAKALKAQGVDVINLAAGEPDQETPAPIKAAAIAAIQEGFTKYTPTAGIPELKAAIAKRFGIGDVVVTNGAKQALYNALQVLCRPGDEVLIPSPYWVSYPEMVKLAGATPVFIRTEPKDQFRLQPQALERALTSKSRLLLLNSPSNPTGAVLPRRLLESIAAVAAARRLFVVSDEIYDQLIYEEPHVSITALPGMRELTVVVNGVSKSYAMTGWRIGYAAGPRPIIEAMVKLQDHATSNPSSISQRAALAALTGDQAPVRAMAQEYKTRRDLVVEALRAVPGLTFVPPQGTFYVFCDISGSGMRSSVFAERLLAEQHLAVIPGDGFGWDTHIRVSFCASREAIGEGVRRLKEFMATCRR